MQSLNASINWLRAALNNSKLENERQKGELDYRDEQIRRLEATLANRDEKICDPLDEQAPSPPELPVCIIQ